MSIVLAFTPARRVIAIESPSVQGMLLDAMRLELRQWFAFPSCGDSRVLEAAFELELMKVRIGSALSAGRRLPPRDRDCDVVGSVLKRRQLPGESRLPGTCPDTT
jgi:hypothetical protein